MKKLIFIGNVVFTCLVVYFISQSVQVLSGKPSMKKKLEVANNEIKELTNKKNSLLEQAKNSDDAENTDKFARNNLNLKKKGEETYKIVD